MKIIKVKDYNEMSDKLNELFVTQLQNKPTSVLSFTTGGTPAGFAKLFVEEINQGVDISQAVCLNLDEYVGTKENPASVYNWMYNHVYNKLNAKPKIIDMFDADAKDFASEIKRYQTVLETYPRDMQLLGLGTNAHIGANEPGTSFETGAFVADCFQSTIDATQNLFNLSMEDTPIQMFTMGFKEIMDAKCVILAASGKSKANAVKRLLEEDIKEDIPASYLKNHENFIFIVDEDACSLLSD